MRNLWFALLLIPSLASADLTNPLITVVVGTDAFGFYECQLSDGIGGGIRETRDYGSVTLVCNDEPDWYPNTWPGFSGTYLDNRPWSFHATEGKDTYDWSNCTLIDRNDWNGDSTLSLSCPGE